MTKLFPPVPQTGRHPVTLTPEQERRLLGRRHTADHTDPFATDANAAVRRLGRLALRRDIEDPSDFFALGDLCAALSLANDRLLIFYVGKALTAYRRAGQIAWAASQGAPEIASGDRELAERIIDHYVHWVLEIALMAPTARNIAVALWAATEIDIERQTEDHRELVLSLAKLYITATQGGSLADSTGRQTVEVPVIAPLLPDAPDADVDAAIQPVKLTDTQPDLSDTASDGAASQSGVEDDEQTDGTRLMQQIAEWLTHELTSPPDESQSRITETPLTPLVPSPTSTLPSATTLDRTVSPLAGPSGGARALHRPPPGSHSAGDFGGDFQKGEAIGGRYEVRDVLRGGMGIIYLCFDHQERQSVAIKTFQSRFSNNERMVRRFTQEAYTWINLEKHRNIVQARKVETFGSERVRERPHIILEFIAGPEGLGPDLKSWIDHNRLDLPTTLEIALGICLGMQHAVRIVPGLVHRDLKPANILVRHDGLAKVTDFGLVRSLDSALDTQEMAALPREPGHEIQRLTRAGAVVGTVPYMSPEQCRGALELDLRSDLYAFGAILFEMLTGRQLFRARNMTEWIEAHLTATPEFPTATLDHVPPELRALTLRCLNKRPEDRPHDWGAALDELAAVYEQTFGSAPRYEISGQELEVRELMDKAYSLTELGFGHEALGAYDRALELSRDSAWVWARKGRTLRVLGKGHLEEAVYCFDRALELDPKFAWAWNQKGFALERLKEYELALEAYETAARLRPNDVYAIHNHGSVLFAMGRSEEALARLDRALMIDPNHAPSHTRRGAALLALRRTDDALRAFERAVALDPSQDRAWLGRGTALLHMRRLEDAASAFMRAMRLRPGDVRSWRLLADTLIALGKLNEALPVVQQATRLKPDNAILWLRLGAILRRLDRFDEAVAAYDKALHLKAGYASALSGKGDALEKLNRRDEALVCYQAALAARPNHRSYMLRYGDALAALNRRDEAREVFEQFVRLYADNKSAWARVGRLRFHAGEREAALDAFRRALALDPKYTRALSGQGMVLSALGRHNEALSSFQQAAALEPAKVWNWFNVADALVSLRKYDDALAVLDRALALNERAAECWAQRGRVLRRMRRFTESVEAYDRALALNPRYAWAWNGQGIALERLRRYEEAIASYERAVEEAPNVLYFRLNLIDPLLALGRREDALDVCDDALKLTSGTEAALPWTRKGQVLRRLNRHDEAVEAYDQALALLPDSGAAWNGKGLACAALGRRTEALACFRRAAELQPDNEWFWYNQGELLIEMGAYEDAIKALNAALEIRPGHKQALLKRDEARKKLFMVE